MVVESEGYIALIEYLVESLGLFEAQQQSGGEQTIEDLVSSRVASNLMAICEQNPQLDPKLRFMIMQEADAVVADLEEVLSAVWLRAPTPDQQAFLEEFIDLIKNLFDGAIS
ncbi:DUF3802 family protein [Aeromonas salmonicida]|uniref:DUF3802 family protein n=1 Tax=Aeromonas salmonicida TaxID=645 RepID=UPI0021164182|nr:DUF3802 family protein [Aeromonas salmonicida]UUI62739.1 DUF3802 family protein [Aeromonas salmonicida]